MRITKTALWALACLCAFQFSQGLANTPQRVIPAGHWAYDAAGDILLESGLTSFAQTAPVSVAELQVYLSEVDYDALSAHSKKQYDRLQDYFRGEKTVFSSGLISLGGNAIVTPEFFARSNDNIDWTAYYYYKNRFLTFPMFLAVSDFVYIESELFVGRSYWSFHNKKIWNASSSPEGAWRREWTDGRNTFINYNTPVHFDSELIDAIEFDWPRKAYISFGVPVQEKYVFNFTLGRGGLSVGKTATGSIVLSENFERDGYARLSFFLRT